MSTSDIVKISELIEEHLKPLEDEIKSLKKKVKQLRDQIPIHSHEGSSPYDLNNIGKNLHPKRTITFKK